MKTVTVRDLRNRGAEVLRRVEHGESLIVTRDGEAVASVVPLPRKALRAEDLISRRRALPRMSSADLRADLDDLVDSSL
ncbi:type II toxin-antitoxin system Phd/YefM family antitoxin [Micrococcus terreus]|uniref:type II toxin-antitoxin system Phd/YefM family antitoxin n=1 Tax=Micrococcus terreus TaxID=574650 RepID=UPI003D7441D2